jgi:hypothetical protein
MRRNPFSVTNPSERVVGATTSPACRFALITSRSYQMNLKTMLLSLMASERCWKGWPLVACFLLGVLGFQYWILSPQGLDFAEVLRTLVTSLSTMIHHTGLTAGEAASGTSGLSDLIDTK